MQLPTSSWKEAGEASWASQQAKKGGDLPSRKLRHLQTVVPGREGHQTCQRQASEWEGTDWAS